MVTDDEFQNLVDRVKKLENSFQSKPDVLKKELSIKEFILSKTPKDDIQKTLVIGYYLEKYNDFSSFNSKDLEDGFRVAKEKVPDNVNYKAIKNIEKGYMMEAKEKKDNLKAWNLTNSGEHFIENNLRDE